MKVTLFGATGMIGGRILAELVSRGHTVTAAVRNPEKVQIAGVTAVAADVLDAESVAAATAGADAVISAYAPPAENPGLVAEAVRVLGAAGVSRLLLVGGAGGLSVAPGVLLVDAPVFPAELRPIALAHVAAHEAAKALDIDWTILSPAALIAPGERTGQFRLGTDSLVTDANGDSRISAEDFAVALVDELEQPRHIRERFTLAY